MSKILLNSGLVMEHSKSEVFHFMRSWYPPLDLTSMGGKESKLSDNEITVVHSSCIYLKKVNYLQVSNKYIVNIK